MSGQQQPRPEGDEFAPDTRDLPDGDRRSTRDIVRGDDPNRSEAPFGRPLGGAAAGSQHDLDTGEHATDSATTYHAPPDPPAGEADRP